MDESTDHAQGTQGGMSEMLGQSFSADQILQGETIAHLSIHDMPIRQIPALPTKITDGIGLLPAAERKNDLTDHTAGVAVDNNNFFTDTGGRKEPFSTQIFSPLARRSQFPDMSDSSDEEVVFSGRGRAGLNMKTNHASSVTVENFQQHSKGSSPRAVKIIDDSVIPSAVSTFRTREHHHTGLLSKRLDSPSNITMNPQSNAHKGSRMKRLQQKQADEEEIFADYIANIDYSDDQKHMTNYLLEFTSDLGIMDDQKDEHPDETAIGTILPRDINWDLSDLDGLSTSSEGPVSVGRVLSKRKRRLGVQYLVTEGGLTVDDARWIPLSSLIMPGAEQHIRIYESNLSKPEECLTDSEGFDDAISSHQIAEDLHMDMNSSLDEHDLLSRTRERPTDEKLARLLSNQEKLGQESSHILLYDGDEDVKNDHFLPSHRGAHPSTLRNRGKKVRSSNQFPSTSAFTGVLNTDALDDFDVIDQRRLNLEKLSRGRRGMPDLELTDTEFENSVQLAWENDRAKKKLYKQKREELRAQGLLGKKNKTNLKSKYSHAISMAELKNEIEELLSSSLER